MIENRAAHVTISAGIGALCGYLTYRWSAVKPLPRSLLAASATSIFSLLALTFRADPDRIQRDVQWRPLIGDAGRNCLHVETPSGEMIAVGNLPKALSREQLARRVAVAYKKPTWEFSFEKELPKWVEVKQLKCVKINATQIRSSRALRAEMLNIWSGRRPTVTKRELDQWTHEAVTQPSILREVEALRSSLSDTSAAPLARELVAEEE